MNIKPIKLTAYLYLIFASAFLYASLSQITDYQLFEYTIYKGGVISVSLVTVVAKLVISLEFTVIVLLLFPRVRFIGTCVFLVLMLFFAGYYIYQSYFVAMTCECEIFFTEMSRPMHTAVYTGLILLSALSLYVSVKNKKLTGVNK